MAMRSRAERQADARAMLAAQHSDVWVSTASSDGVAHLVPLSFAWDGELVTLVTAPTTPTARNLQATERARLAFGQTRDVVMMDATLEGSMPSSAVPEGVAEAYAAQVDWDPRQGGTFVYLRLRPERVMAWRGVDENRRGRTIMRDGRWLG